MVKNIIYYGPPGTGKTYHMQKLISDYTDYKITDDEIVKAYTNYSQDWLLFALIILQSNTTMTTEEIIKKVKNEFIENLAIGISNLVNIFEPEIVCIGGSFVHISDLIIPKVKEEIKNKKLLFNARKELKIVPASLGNDAGIIGAASIL